MSAIVCVCVQKEGTLSPYKSSLVKAQRHPEVVTLTEADVHRMKSDAHIMTAEERSSLRHEIEERKEHERAAAKARKEKMLRLEAEAKQQVCVRWVCVPGTTVECSCMRMHDVLDSCSGHTHYNADPYLHPAALPTTCTPTHSSTPAVPVE